MKTIEILSLTLLLVIIVIIIGHIINVSLYSNYTNCENPCPLDVLCPPNKCGAHGSCAAGLCTCSEGWTGASCETAPVDPVDPCPPNKCGAHGSCAAGLCTCSEGWTGTLCQTAPVDPVDPCPPNKCGAHGLCAAGLCTCSEGWTGASCETAPVDPVDPCLPNPCGAHGLCAAGLCTCSEGWTGASCETAPVRPVSASTNMTPFANNVRSYFGAVYPATLTAMWRSMPDASVIKLWYSLNWYYVPLIGDVGLQEMLSKTNVASLFSRRTPLQGPYVNQWTEAFLSDSTDQQIWFEFPVRNQKTPCTGTVENPYLAEGEIDRCKDCFGKHTGDCATCCSPGDVCVGDEFGVDDPRRGTCQMGLVSTYCSVFPSEIQGAMGGTYTSGVHACALSELTGVNAKYPSAACQNTMLGRSADGKTSTFNASKDASNYQFVTLIQPFARKQGCPSYAFMEQVAYVCEGVGKSLLTAPLCEYPSGDSSSFVAAFQRNKICDFQCAGESDWPACVESAASYMVNSQQQTPPPPPQVPITRGQNRDRYERPKASTPASSLTSRRGVRVATPGSLVGGMCYFKDYDVFAARKPNGGDIWNGTTTKPAGNAILPDGTKPTPVGLSATYALSKCGAHPRYTNTSQCSDKTMFYWEAGYGKFMNMGKTAVYNSYIHLYLTIPNQFPVGGHGRQTGLETIEMGAASGAKLSLESLMSSSATYKDRRPTLEGYVTTFQTGSVLGAKYKLVPGTYSKVLEKNVPIIYDVDATDDDWNTKIIVITGRLYWAKRWGPFFDPIKRVVIPQSENTWFNEIDFVGNHGPAGLENSQGMMNPQEGINQWVSEGLHNQENPIASTEFVGDANLCHIASQCIHCYYPPNLQIANPHYNQAIGMGNSAGLTFWQAMYIYGDVGGDTYGYSTSSESCRQLSASSCFGFPYGTYYMSADIGSCVYALVAAMQWNSVQFSLMSTGGGNAKFCTYPGYDYEIVQIANRQLMCQGADEFSFNLVDVTAGGQVGALDFYAKYGFVQGCATGGDLPSIEANSLENANARITINKAVLNWQPFSVCKMPLNEANVDSQLFGKHTVNELFYQKPTGSCEDSNLDTYYDCLSQSGSNKGFAYYTADKSTSLEGARDCPYKDGIEAIRQKATDGGYLKRFVNSVSDQTSWPITIIPNQ